MVDVVSRAAITSNSAEFVWHRIGQHITGLFDDPRPSSLNLVITLMSPHVNWVVKLGDRNAVTKWAATASMAQHMEVVCRSVVGALLRIAPNKSPRSHIPIELLMSVPKNQQSLPPSYPGCFCGTLLEVARFIRGLGDFDLLNSYFLLVWSEWCWVDTPGLDEMGESIREEFGGIWMRDHRKQLIERLDHVLRQLDRGWDTSGSTNPGLTKTISDGQGEAIGG